MGDKRRVIKLHKTDVSIDNIDFHLAKGDVVRLTELPEDFSLEGYEVYGDGTIDHDAILGDVSLMKHTPRMDLLSRRFAKHDPSEYAGTNGRLDWLAALEQMVDGDVISTAHVRKAKTQVQAHSIWYNVTARVITSVNKPPDVYTGTLISSTPIINLPAYVAKGAHMTFANNFITTSSDLVKLGDIGFDTRIEITSATPNSDGLKGNVGYGLTTLKIEPKRLYYLVGRKGSGKSTKLEVLSKIGNVEDSDDYGIFLTRFLSSQGKLDLPIDDIMEWQPDANEFRNSLEVFLSNKHDYENERSFFHILSQGVLDSKIEPVKRTYALLRLINRIMAHPYIGVQRYAALRSRYDDITKPTFVMCHSFAETGFRPTPDDTIMLSDVIDAWGIIQSRSRGGSTGVDEAEVLLYFAYAEGISTINKLAPFALILEQLRRECKDVTLGCLQITEQDTS
jgi:energy-coupling factor transporter ATP-binding protein EcfA2